MTNFFNRAVHFGVGVWVGAAINDDDYRHGGYATGTAFLAYEIVQAWRKGDDAYGEIREFAVGLAVALATRRAVRWYRGLATPRNSSAQD